MANIPEDGVVLAEDSALEDEANPDKRKPQQLWDKQITPDNEFEEGKSGNRNESLAKGLFMFLNSKEAFTRPIHQSLARTKWCMPNL